MNGRNTSNSTVMNASTVQQFSSPTYQAIAPKPPTRQLENQALETRNLPNPSTVFLNNTSPIWEVNIIRCFILSNSNLSISSPTVRAVLSTLDTILSKNKSCPMMNSNSACSSGSTTFPAVGNTIPEQQNQPSKKRKPTPSVSVSLSQRKWSEMFDQLKCFMTRNGHCDIPYAYPQNPKLVNWVSSQREHYKNYQKSMQNKDDGDASAGTGSSSKPKITQERITDLENIGFLWTCSRLRQQQQVQNEAWWNQLEHLREYKTKYGHCRVPRKHQNDPKLGNWVSANRKNYSRLQNGESSTLNPERVRALIDLGFVWRVESLRDDNKWNCCYEELVTFHESNGHFRVPMNTKLGVWVNHQRTNYKWRVEGRYKNSLKMTDDRVNKLNLIGFVWNLRENRVYRDEDGNGLCNDGDLSESIC